MKLLALNEDEIQIARSTVTFTGLGGNGQTGTQTKLFIISGRVLVLALPVFVDDDLTQSGASASISFGTASQVTRFTAANTVTALDTNEWFKTGEAVIGSQALGTTQLETVINEDIVADHTGAEHCNGGTITVECWYLPLSLGGRLQ